MERKEILEKLKLTEAEIRSNIEAAQHKRNEILAQAQKQAQKIEDDEEQRLKKEREKAIVTARKEIELKRQHILKKAKIDAETLKKNAQIQKAIEFFIDEFMESIYV